MNKLLRRIGVFLKVMADLIKVWSTIEVGLVVLSIPIIFMLILYVGEIPQGLIGNKSLIIAANNYAAYLCIMIGAWFFPYIQKNIIMKSKTYKRMLARRAIDGLANKC